MYYHYYLLITFSLRPSDEGFPNVPVSEKSGSFHIIPVLLRVWVDAITKREKSIRYNLSECCPWRMRG